MTNAELIAELQKHPGHLNVVLELGARYTSTVSSVAVADSDDDTGQYLYLYVNGDDVTDHEAP